MKAKINLFVGITFMLLLTVTTQINAQRMPMPHRTPLESVVDLTDAQKAEIQKINETYKEKFDALRQGEKSDANRAAMQQLMQERQAAVSAVLTPEQRTKWDAAQAEQKAKMEQNRANREANHEKMQAAREEMKAYQEKNVDPVLQKQRAKLESKISTEDKKLIAELRAQRAPHRPEGFVPGQRGNMGRKFEDRGKRGDKAPDQSKRTAPQNDEKRAQIKALVDKYSADIDALYAGIATQEKQWEQDRKAIMEKYAPNPSDEKMKRPGFQRKPQGQKQNAEDWKARMDFHKKLRFLLLDPNEPTTTSKTAAVNRKVNAYPNPAGATQNLEFDVLQSGKVLVEIIDGQGNVVKTVFNGNLEKGTNKLQVNTGDLKGKSYFYRITDAQGTTTKAFIIQ